MPGNNYSSRIEARWSDALVHRIPETSPWLRRFWPSLSVLGKDQKGVVAQFATYMAERGINIEDIEQRVVRGFFVMDMLVDLKDLSCDLSELITGLLELGKKIDMEVRVHLHGERRAKRIALLVSKEPHCLQQLIDDCQARQAARRDRRRARQPPRPRTASPRQAGLPFALARRRRRPSSTSTWLRETA